MANYQILLACLALLTFLDSKFILMFDTRADYVVHTEEDATELNHATLVEDPNADLPDQFTICGSFLMENMVSWDLSWFLVLKDDFTQWVYLSTRPKNVEEDTEAIIHSFWIQAGGVSHYIDDFGPFRFTRWFHMCASFDMVTGLISPVVDGFIIPSKAVEKISQDRPSTLAGRIVLGKLFHANIWKATPQLVGNIQVFGRVLSEEDMISITAGTMCGSSGDYLAWNQVRLKKYIGSAVHIF